MDGTLDTSERKQTFLNNLLTIHLTDEKYYNNFEYEMRAKIKLDSSFRTREPEPGSSGAKTNDNELALKHLLYLADFMSKLKVKYQTTDLVLKKRQKQMEQMIRDYNKK